MSEHAERVSVAPLERLVERSPRDEGLGPVVTMFVVSVIAAYGRVLRGDLRDDHSVIPVARIYVTITALFL